MGPILSLTSSDNKVKKQYTAEHLRGPIEIDEDDPLDIPLGLVITRDMRNNSRVDGGLPSHAVSGIHARLNVCPCGSKFYITDLRSRHGTFLQPSAHASPFRLEPDMAYQLLSGDRISFGQGAGAMELVVRISQGSGLGADTGEGGRRVLMPPWLEDFAPTTILTAPQLAKTRLPLQKKISAFLLHLSNLLFVLAAVYFLWDVVPARLFSEGQRSCPSHYDITVEITGAPRPFTISTPSGVYEFPNGGQSRG